VRNELSAELEDEVSGEAKDELLTELNISSQWSWSIFLRS